MMGLSYLPPNSLPESAWQVFEVQEFLRGSLGTGPTDIITEAAHAAIGRTHLKRVVCGSSVPWLEASLAKPGVSRIDASE